MLVELNGHTQRGSLDILRRRPAPVQVELAGLCRHQRRAVHRYADRRPHRGAGPIRLQRKAGISAGKLLCHRHHARHRRLLPAAPKQDCPRDGFVFCGFQSCDETGRRKALRAGCASWRRCPAACCGCGSPGERPSPICSRPRRGMVSRLSAWSLPAHAPADVHLARHALAGPVPGHAALQCPCHRSRRAVDRAAGPDLRARLFRRPGRGQPAACGGLARIDNAPTPEDYEAMAVALAKIPNGSRRSRPNSPPIAPPRRCSTRRASPVISRRSMRNWPSASG